MTKGKDIIKAFGLAVKELRQDKNISQEKMAELGNLDRSFISEIENGYKTASIVTVSKIAKALDVKPSEIFLRIEQ